MRERMGNAWSTGSLRTVLYLLVLLACDANAGSASRFELRIERLQIDAAMAQLANQTGLQIARLSDPGDADTLVGPLSGLYGVDEALRALLAGSGFAYRWVDERTIAVTRRHVAMAGTPSRPSAQVPAAPTFVPPEDKNDVGGDARVLEEVFVSARRFAEDRQVVPLTVSVLSAEDLRKNDIETTADVERRIPGFSICCSRSVAYTFLRGVPGVVSYFSEAPTAVSSDALLFDLKGLQVLKGPQGTLFGLSSNGGAFLFEPKRPAETFEADAKLIFGDANRRGGQVVVNVPVNDKLLLRFGALTDRSDGYVRDVAQNTQTGADNHQIVRISALYRPAAGLESYLVANYYKFNADDDTIKHLGFLNPGSPAAALFPDYASYFAQQAALGIYSYPGGAERTFVRVEQLNVVDVTTWEINAAVRFKNILGYSERTDWERFNSDGTPDFVAETNIYGTRPGPTAQLSEEPQLQGNFFEDVLKVQVGGYYQDTTLHSPHILYNYALGTLSGDESANEGDTHAIYGQATYDASSWLKGLSLTGGYRYTWDHLKFRQQRYDATGAPAGDFVHLQGDFSAPSYTLSATYQLAAQTMVYFTNSKGYSTGGFNVAAPPQFQKYQPENLNNFEVGLKSEWTLGPVPLRTNAAAFYGKYNDIQVYTNVLIPTPAGPVSGTFKQNAAKAHIQGAELEATALIGPLQIDANVGFQQAKYDEYMSGGVDLRFVPIYYIAKWKYSLNGTYTLPVAAALGDMSLNANYTWQTRMPSPVSYISSKFDMPAYGSLNLSYDWQQVLGSKVDLTFLVSNVTNNWHNSNGNHPYDTVGYFNLDVAVPRRWSLRLKYDF